MPPLIHIEIVYALPERQTLLALDVPEGTTLDEALTAGALCERHPELDWRTQKVGIFGHPVGLDRVLEHGDRIEVYRPLIADPKASRQARVEKRRTERGDGGRKMRA